MMGKALSADIASGFFDPESFDLRAEGFEGKIIPVTTPRFKKKLRQIKLRLAFFFGTGFLKDYKTVIFSGDCISAVRNTAKDAKKIYYCHTPPRYIFDRKDDYLKKVSWFLRPFFLGTIALFKWAYLRDLSKMDIIITNSTNTQKRLKKFTGYDSTIIYPPVDIERFKKNSAIPKKHYLSFSRLANIKRVDTIVKAFQ
jgi:glycosyltransferase involved in cell wall biosynthesis